MKTIIGENGLKQHTVDLLEDPHGLTDRIVVTMFDLKDVLLLKKKELDENKPGEYGILRYNLHDVIDAQIKLLDEIWGAKLE